jgi:excisionase family DNA binding protein
MDSASTIKSFCERYDICRPTFYQLVRSGQLEARKLGRKTIITREAELAFLAKLPRLCSDSAPAAA